MSINFVEMPNFPDANTFAWAQAFANSQAYDIVDIEGHYYIQTSPGKFVHCKEYVLSLEKAFLKAKSEKEFYEKYTLVGLIKVQWKKWQQKRVLNNLLENDQ